VVLVLARPSEPWCFPPRGGDFFEISRKGGQTYHPKKIERKNHEHKPTIPVKNKKIIKKHKNNQTIKK